MAKSIPNDIYQYSMFSAYNAGLKDGGPPVAFLTNHGTHGIGIFEDEDEDSSRAQGDDMIQLDSIAYSLDDDGEASEADREDQMPFVMVTVFQPQQKVRTPNGTTRQKVTEVFERGKNTPIPFRLTGKFKYISTRQQTHWDVTGVMFGFCIPERQSQISGEGLQCCFLNDGKSVGGRVNDFETGEGALLEWAKCGRFHLGFPQDEEYDQLRLGSVQRRNTSSNR